MKFIYKAKKGPGKTVEGELDAESHTAALAALDGMGLSPVWVREGLGVDAGSDESRRTQKRRHRITKRDVTVFTRQLGSLTKSGVPILRALATIGEQTESVRFQRVLGNIESMVRDGNMLSVGLQKHPRLFSELYVSMVRAGESGGVLDKILFRLADAREKEEETARKVQAAIAYPVLVVVVGIVTVFVLLSFFLPRVIALFDDYTDLPLPTKILIGITNLCSGSWHWVLMVVLLVAAVLRALAALEGGRIFFDRIKLHLPVVGVFMLQADIARFARTLSLLVESGIPIDKALELSGHTLRNTTLKIEIERVKVSTVQQGMPLSSGLKRCCYFPVMVANMCAVGEEGGRLEEALDEVAQFYEKDLDQRTKLVTALLEPVLILVVGAIVGFIVAAMLLPIFTIGKGL